MNTVGFASRIAVSISPFASVAFDGMITRSPGTCINQALVHAERSAVSADVLAEKDDLRVPPHFVADCLVDRFGHGQFTSVHGVLFHACLWANRSRFRRTSRRRKRPPHAAPTFCPL